MNRFYKYMSIILVCICSIFCLSACGNPYIGDPVKTNAMLDNFIGIKAIYVPDNSTSDEQEKALDLLQDVSTEILYKLSVYYGLGYSSEITLDDYFGVGSSEWTVSNGIVNTVAPTENLIVSFPTNIILDDTSQAGTYNAINLDNWAWNVSSEGVTSAQFLNSYIDAYKNKLTAKMVNLTLGLSENDALDISNNITNSMLVQQMQEFKYYGLTSADIQEIQSFILSTIIGTDVVNGDNTKANDVDLSKDFVIVKTISGVEKRFVFDSNFNGNDSNFTATSIQVVTDGFKNYSGLVSQIVSQAVANNLEDQLGAGRTHYYNLHIQNYSAEYLKTEITASGGEAIVLPARQYVSIVYMNKETITTKDEEIVPKNNPVLVSYGSWMIGQEGDAEPDVDLTINYRRSDALSDAFSKSINAYGNEDRSFVLDSGVNNEFSFSKSFVDQTSGGSPSVVGGTDATPLAVFAGTSFASNIMNVISFDGDNGYYVDSNCDVLQIIFSNPNKEAFIVEGVESLLFEKN